MLITSAILIKNVILGEKINIFIFLSILHLMNYL